MASDSQSTPPEDPDPDPMAISISAGTQQLLQIGVSISDIALLVNAGRKYGNFFRVAKNDDELLSSIGEDTSALLKRRDLVQPNMDRKWGQTRFIYQGKSLETGAPSHQISEASERYSAFTWIMISIITCLDLCLPSNIIQTVIRKLMFRVLNGNEALESSLRILLPVNIGSWRSAGCVRGLAITVRKTVQHCRTKITGDQAIPQLNQAETEEVEALLVWLFEGKTNDFYVVSATVYAVAVAMRKLGVQIRTEGQRKYEAEPIVHYTEDADAMYGSLSSRPSPFHETRGLRSIAQQIAFPHREPMAMIYSMATGKDNLANEMIRAWALGEEAAYAVSLKAEAEDSYTNYPEVYYAFIEPERDRKVFPKEAVILAGRAFGTRCSATISAVNQFTSELAGPHISWLQQNTEIEYLRKNENKSPSRNSQEMDLWLKYQALVFGFYYKLFEPLLILDFVHEDACFKGLWGHGSTTFLGMCIEFGEVLRTDGKVSRAHILFMLSTMFAGRQKWFPRSTIGKGLVGVMGPISILSRPLLHSSDQPEDIAKFMLADLPIVDLVADTDGELFAGKGGAVSFDNSVEADGKIENSISVTTPKKWSLHAKMAELFNDGEAGVVMAARCAGTFVGWFNPVVADVAFLSQRFLREVHTKETKERESVDEISLGGFHVTDDHWQAGKLPRPIAGNSSQLVGVVQSKKNPVLRYAATGFLAEIGVEVAIATDDVEAAIRKVEGQGEGYVVA